MIVLNLYDRVKFIWNSMEIHVLILEPAVIGYSTAVTLPPTFVTVNLLCLFFDEVNKNEIEE